MSFRQVIVNLAGTKPIDDPEYRYKMPLVIGKIEGRGNGIKTVIANISDVALSLHRSPGEVNKFFGCELGAQTTYAADTDRAVVNGAHTDVALQNLMKRYIDKFVLCPGCGLPETDFKIKSNQISHRCKACGCKEAVDMSHKLCTYIVAQDKKAKKEGKGKDKKKSKEKDNSDEDKDKEKKKKKKEKKEEDDDKDKDKKKKKDKDKDKKKKKKDKSGNDEKKEEELAQDLDDLSLDATDDVTLMDMAIDATKQYLASHPDASSVELLELVVNQQMASALKSFDKIHIFIRAAITPDFWEKKLVQKHAPTISLITNQNPIMERHVIAALEGLSVDSPKHFPVLLKLMFDEEALDEGVILEWACEGRTDYTLVSEEVRADLRAEAEPVVMWLQDDDSDDDEDDEDEE